MYILSNFVEVSRVTNLSHELSRNMQIAATTIHQELMRLPCLNMEGNRINLAYRHPDTPENVNPSPLYTCVAQNPAIPTKL